ncbi:MAG: PAS domain-containing protein, partial [Bdellovibrionales bacterium]
MKSESLRLIAKLELALEGSGFGIWELDLQTGRLIWDERMHKIYGYEPGAFHGDPEEWKSRLHEQDRVLVDRRFQDLIEGKRVELFEFRIINKLTGEIRTLEANGIMQLGLDGKPARVVGMNRDVSDRKHLAESLEYERAARVTASKLASLG